LTAAPIRRKQWIDMSPAQIPVMLARIEDRLFLGLPAEEAKAWPTRLRAAFDRPKDLSGIPWRFLHYLLTDSGIPDLDDPLIKAPIDQCAAVLRARADQQKISAASGAVVVRQARHAALEAGLEGICDASAYCAALAVEAALAQSEAAAAAKAIDAIEAAEWATSAGDEPGLYSRMAEKLIQLIEASPIKYRSTIAALP
jgi:hypothetical protein